MNDSCCNIRIVASCLAVLGLSALGVQAEVVVSLCEDAPSGDSVVVRFDDTDVGGNTSVANDAAEVWKASGRNDAGYYIFDPTKPPTDWAEIPYIKRDRDLGQTFTYTGEHPARLDAITLRTGFGTNIVRPGMYRQAVSIQLFTVTGLPVINHNGTEPYTLDGERFTKTAAHGWPHRIGDIEHTKDDYILGESYRSLAVARGGRFPSRSDFGLSPNEEPRSNHPHLKGRFLRFDLTGRDEITLRPGQRYAFLVMIDEPGNERGFTLANRFQGSYARGHGIRREGRGDFPPIAADPRLPIEHSANAAALASANFAPDFSQRTAVPPGTNGYPDVCTWRDLVFFVEATPCNTPDSSFPKEQNLQHDTQPTP